MEIIDPNSGDVKQVIKDVAPIVLHKHDHTGNDRAIKKDLAGKVGVGGVNKEVVSYVRNLRNFLAIFQSHEFEFVSCWLE